MINALITLADDSVHRVLYVGDLALGFLGAVERGPFSTLEADYEFNIENCFLQLYYDGARYGADRGGWEIRFMNDLSFMSGDFLRFPVIVESLDTDINVLCRTFTADTTSSYAIGTFLTGYKFDYGLYGSWYFPVSGGGFGYYASAIADGTFVFELKGEDAVMTVDVVDDRGYKIKGKAYCPKNNISLYDSSNQR